MADIVGTSSTENSISGTVQFDGSSSGGTAKLYWRISGGGWSLWSTYSSTSSFSIGGLSSSTNYQVSVDSYAANGTVTYGPFVDIYTTAPSGPRPDTRGPTVSQTYDPRGTSIICSWSIRDITDDDAYDIESGFNRAYMFVGGADSYSPRTQILTTYAEQTNFTCTTDGTGAAIQPNKTYTFHWEAYDNAGNWSVTSPVSVTTTMPRPPNFYWNPAVVSGAAYNMTTNQWRFFTDQVNAFRGYKGFTPYAFSNVFAGQQPTANHYNEARNAIYGMNGNIPPYRNPGENIYASDYNGLQDSLNAVS